jgi:hypothetical protein
MLETIDRIVPESIAAEVIGMSVYWLRTARLKGSGPTFIKIGTAVRYHVSDLVEFREAHKLTPARATAKREWKADRRLEPRGQRPARRFKRTPAYVEAMRIELALQKTKR